MARRKRSRNHLDGERDDFSIASNAAPATSVAKFAPVDRRQFHPSPLKPTRGFLRSDTDQVVRRVRNVRSHAIRVEGVRSHGRSVNRVLKQGKRKDVLSRNEHRLYFRVPARVAVCVRRKQRKEVMFALKRTGRGAKSRKHFNPYSEVRC